MSFHLNRAIYSLLNGHIIPVNGEGDTEFADERENEVVEPFLH